MYSILLILVGGRFTIFRHNHHTMTQLFGHLLYMCGPMARDVTW